MHDFRGWYALTEVLSASCPVVPANAFNEVLTAEGPSVSSEQEVFPVSAEELKAGMRNNKVNLANLTTSDLGIYARPEAALKLTTLHYSKGRELQAVAMIEVHEGKLPLCKAVTQEELNEEKRKFKYMSSGHSRGLASIN